MPAAALPGPISHSLQPPAQPSLLPLPQAAHPPQLLLPPEANQTLVAATSAAVPAIPAPAAGSSSTPPSATLSGLLFGQQSSALLEHYLAYNSTAAYLNAPQYGEPVYGLSQDMAHGMTPGVAHGMTPASSQYQPHEDSPSLSSPAA